MSSNSEDFPEEMEGPHSPYGLSDEEEGTVRQTEFPQSPFDQEISSDDGHDEFDQVGNAGTGAPPSLPVDPVHSQSEGQPPKHLSPQNKNNGEQNDTSFLSPPSAIDPNMTHDSSINSSFESNHSSSQPTPQKGPTIASSALPSQSPANPSISINATPNVSSTDNSKPPTSGESPRRKTTRYIFTEQIQDTNTPLHDVVPSFQLKKLPPFAFGERKITSETLEVCQLLHEAVQMRTKNIPLKYPWKSTHLSVPPTQEPETPKVSPSENPFTKHGKSRTPVTKEAFYIRKGVMICDEFTPVVSYLEHYADFKRLRDIIWHAATKSYCHSRLKLLDFKFSLYKALCAKNELTEQKNVQHRDFYNSRKVDNHVHLSSCMNQKHLLRFIKRKMRDNGDDVVLKINGKEQTLSDVFRSLNLTAYDLNVDSLEVHAGGKAVVHRFDKFNAKYNPFGQSELREIFLKTDNYIKGSYFAEICKEVFTELDESKYIMSEPRVSIYGRKREEWDSLAEWVVDNDLFCQNVRWMIQIPRLYHLHKKRGFVKTFQDMLENIFLPLFEVTRDPSSHPKLHKFLKLVVAFDHVDDESKSEGRFHSRLPMPDVWCTQDNPPYNYYNYFIWANLNVLNQYRKSKGLTTFGFRPHAGEAGDVTHLLSSYLLADSIAHGIEVRHTPVLEYLYYLCQVGMSVSPLSNNHLFLPYRKSVFPRFFSRGLNVTLSTDDPLMFHFTKEPLMEEYSIAAQVWHFSAADLCEIARNSVLQSGWDDRHKQYWISPFFDDYGPRANQVQKTNVPSIRMQYRYETFMEEHLFIQKCLHIADFSESVFLKFKPLVDLPTLHRLINELRTSIQLRDVRDRMNLNPMMASPENKFPPIRTSCAGVSTDDANLLTQVQQYVGSNRSKPSTVEVDEMEQSPSGSQIFYNAVLPVSVGLIGVFAGSLLTVYLMKHVSKKQ